LNHTDILYMHFSFALKLKSFNSSESEVSESWRNATVKPYRV